MSKLNYFARTDVWDIFAHNIYAITNTRCFITVIGDILEEHLYIKVKIKFYFQCYLWKQSCGKYMLESSRKISDKAIVRKLNFVNMHVSFLFVC